MQIFGEILVEIIFRPLVYFLFAVPGAFIRWVFSRLWGSSTTLYHFARVEPLTSGVVGVFAFSLIGIMIASGS